LPLRSPGEHLIKRAKIRQRNHPEMGKTLLKARLQKNKKEQVQIPMENATSLWKRIKKQQLSPNQAEREFSSNGRMAFRTQGGKENF